MSITKKAKLLVETKCDECGESMGTSLIDKSEYGDWLKHTIDLLTFDIDGEKILCWSCIKKHGLVRAYNQRLNDLTYPPPGKEIRGRHHGERYANRG